jgi:L-ascorbate metabolism protein UlaG (beta-lactamase superfamily)
MRTDTLRFTWVGGPTFIFEVGGFKLLSDPMFSEGSQAFLMNGHPSTGEDRAAIARLAPLPKLDLRGIDALVISHLHSDHFDSNAEERLDKNLTVICAYDHTQEINGRGFRNTNPLDWWNNLTFTKGEERITLTALPARHSHDPRMNIELGLVNGYWIEYRSPSIDFRTYWTGDTIWFDDLQLVQRRFGPLDLFVPHLGAVGMGGPYGMMTLNADEAVQMVELFGPDAIIPIHHHTFSHYVEPIDALRERLLGTKYRKRLHLLKEGQSWFSEGSKPITMSDKDKRENDR